MSELNCLRGFKDLILEDAEHFNHIVNIVSEVALNYNFKKSHFPILEASSVYKRTLGEASDIVNKEMYSFVDNGENEVTLRPEFTAGIVRSVISNKLYDQMPLKFFSYGPLFRYERPQKGRQRQFHQINFEYFGNDSYLAEVELLLLINQLIAKLGIEEKLALEVNSLGSDEARSNYRDALVKYFETFKHSLSEDSQKRLLSNPLRILDSKDKGDKEIIQDAPKLSSYYTEEDKSFFENLLDELAGLNIKFEINPRLVRGLDYYSHTVFEYTTDLLGAQNAVFAGGRYDKLIEIMGGKATPAVGFAGGLERLVELVDSYALARRLTYVVAVSDAERKYAFKILEDIRSAGFKSEAILSGGNIGKRLKKAGKHNPNFVMIVGEDEKNNETVTVRNFATGEEAVISRANLIEDFAKLYA